MISRRSRMLFAELVGDHIHPFRVNVTGLHYGTTVADVRALFKGAKDDYKSIPQVGGVQLAAPTSRDKGTPFFTGRAWVTFDNPEEAVHASDAMNGRLVHSVDGGWRRVGVFCNFSGPKIVREEKWPPVPEEYRLRKVTALKAVGGRKFNHFPVMTLNEQKHRFAVAPRTSWTIEDYKSCKKNAFHRHRFPLGIGISSDTARLRRDHETLIQDYVKLRGRCMYLASINSWQTQRVPPFYCCRYKGSSSSPSCSHPSLEPVIEEPLEALEAKELIEHPAPAVDLAVSYPIERVDEATCQSCLHVADEACEGSPFRDEPQLDEVSSVCSRHTGCGRESLGPPDSRSEGSNRDSLCTCSDLVSYRSDSDNSSPSSIGVRSPPIPNDEDKEWPVINWCGDGPHLRKAKEDESTVLLSFSSRRDSTTTCSSLESYVSSDNEDESS